jgi:hypothetical protein
MRPNHPPTTNHPPAPNPPAADSLYVEEVDVGEGAPRQVVSGLVKHIPDAAQLAGRRVLVVANMKPANMRGVQSQAMVLAATGAGGKLELVEPPAGAALGERRARAGARGRWGAGRLRAGAEGARAAPGRRRVLWPAAGPVLGLAGRQPPEQLPPPPPPLPQASA